MKSHMGRPSVFTQQAWTEAPKEHRDIEPEKWHTPEKWHAPRYLTKAHGAPRSGRKRAGKFPRDRSLGSCCAAEGVVDAPTRVDRLLPEHLAPDLVNMVSLERQVRQGDADWNRPSARKVRSSKVDWSMIHHVDFASVPDTSRGELVGYIRKALQTAAAGGADGAKLEAG